ncbi:MAG: glycoside hydrolase family 32 protein [Thermoguttaceae bacterium]|nr:glycoside hydrolase family 32 protein [Thermoguttaceae bacterium]MDW8038190.1 glycoside hydrolase family 32 protein [Thermoguttaceae bacterium]
MGICVGRQSVPKQPGKTLPLVCRMAMGVWIVHALAFGLWGAETPPDRPDMVIDDFERAEYAPWKAEGEAFGPGPAEGTLPNQMPVTGYQGRRLVNSYFKGDGTTGILTSPPFTIQRRYIAFLIGGGGYQDETYLELLIDGKGVRRACGPNTAPGGSEELDWANWDVSELAGKTAQLRIVDRRTGGWGHINVDSLLQTDRPPPPRNQPWPMKVTARYVLLPVAGNGDKISCQLLHQDQKRVLYYFNIALAADDRQTRFWASIDLEGFQGKTLFWQTRPASAKELFQKRLQQADRPLWPKDLYQEPYRPQFHFSPRVGWTNDPNGLVYHDGLYHLFFQHNPFGIPWGNMTWGHAVSRDLVHWEQWPNAIWPDQLGTIFSGSAVVDLNNMSGLGQPGKPALCAFYTAAGDHSYKPGPFTQCLAYSLDGGQTWKKYQGNPVLEQIAPGNRDPKVFWHEPTGRWIMVLYVRRDAFSIFSSPDLKQWRLESEVDFPTAHECPELFELPVDGDPKNTRWVIWTASGNHRIGRFDGRQFIAESEVLPSEWGANCYAGQTWNNEPKGRRIFIGWMNSDGSAYPGMPFNQQMTVPRQFSVRTTESGLRLFSQPIPELENLRRKTQSWENLRLAGPQRRRQWEVGDLLDVEIQLEATKPSVVTLDVRGVRLIYDPGRRQLECLGKKISDLPVGQGLDLRLLVDRTSLEIFVLGGRFVMSFCHPFGSEKGTFAVEADPEATIRLLKIHPLASIWQPSEK